MPNSITDKEVVNSAGVSSCNPVSGVIWLSHLAYDFFHIDSTISAELKSWKIRSESYKDERYAALYKELGLCSQKP